MREEALRVDQGRLSPEVCRNVYDSVEQRHGSYLCVGVLLLVGLTATSDLRTSGDTYGNCGSWSSSGVVGEAGDCRGRERAGSGEQRVQGTERRSTLAPCSDAARSVGGMGALRSCDVRVFGAPRPVESPEGPATLQSSRNNTRAVFFAIECECGASGFIHTGSFAPQETGGSRAAC